MVKFPMLLCFAIVYGAVTLGHVLSMGSVSVIYGWECVALLLNICRIETVVLKEITSVIKTQKEPNRGRFLTVWLREQRLYVVENLEWLLSAKSGRSYFPRELSELKVRFGSNAETDGKATGVPKSELKIPC